MKHILTIVSLAVTVIGLCCSRGWASESTTNTVSQAGDILRDAYLSVVDAEFARSDQRYVDAAASYRTALGLYGRLQAEYPGWQSTMVNYRVADCQNALAVLDSGKPDGGDSLFSGQTNTEQRLKSLLNDLHDARITLAAQPGSAPTDNGKQWAKERDHLQDELRQEIKANHALIRKLAKMEVKLSRAGLIDSTNTQCKAVSAAVKSEARRMMELNQAGEAIVLLREACEMMPTENGLLLTLAMAQCRIGKFADCILTLRAFDSLRPANADALLTLGTAQMGLGEIGDARASTEKAIKINPTFAEAHYNLAQILVSLMPPDVDGAQKHYQRSLELGLKPDPDFENSLRMNLIITKIKKHNAQTRRTTTERPTAKTIPAPAP